MLGIVLACGVPLARVGVVPVSSCFTGFGDGDLEPMTGAAGSCVGGVGAMSRGSILDIGGGEDGRCAGGRMGAGGAESGCWLGCRCGSVCADGPAALNSCCAYSGTPFRELELRWRWGGGGRVSFGGTGERS